METHYCEVLGADMNERTLFDDVMDIPSDHVRCELHGRHNMMDIRVPSVTSKVESAKEGTRVL